MPTWLLQPVRLVAGALSAHETPRQLAWGAALGMLLGLVPKGNLTALVLAVLLFSLRVNLATGLAAACAFSWLGPLLDPLAHRLGWQILSYRPLQPVFAWCYDLPLVAWSDLNNTVVVGQLVLGLYALYPAYWLSLQAATRWGEPLAERIRKYPVARALFGFETAPRLEASESIAADLPLDLVQTVFPRTAGVEPRDV